MNRLTLLGAGRAASCMGTMAFAGALPLLRVQWHMDAATAGSIQTAFNLANAFALLAAAWLSDSVGARKVHLASSWAGALATALFAMLATSPERARLCIVLVGLTQGGCYAAALLLAAELSAPHQRGRALGAILAAGSFGYLVSVLVSYAATAAYGAQAGFGLCAVGMLIGAFINQAALAGHPDRPDRPFTRQATPGRHGAIAWRDMWSPVSICLLIGYVAHTWELLGFWAWTPALLTATLGQYRLDAMSSGLVIACVIHLTGMLANAVIGRLSDRWPRGIVLVVIGGVGALSSALTGWSATLAGPWSILCAVLGSFFILGDSGVLSAAMSEAVAPGHLGKVMGLRSLLGFSAGALSPIVFGMTLDTTGHWGWSYLTLAAGGIIACSAALCLHFITRKKIHAKTYANTRCHSR